MPVTIVGNNTPTAGGVVYGDGTNYASTAAGSSGQVLRSNGASAPSWATVGGDTFTKISTTYTATAGDKLLVDTSAGAFTVNLPASPTTGQTVYFQDSAGTWGVNVLTVGRNGNTIMGVAENMEASNANMGFGLVYNGSDWRVY